MEEVELKDDEDFQKIVSVLFVVEYIDVGVIVFNVF